jgi:peroxiredoxin
MTSRFRNFVSILPLCAALVMLATCQPAAAVVAVGDMAPAFTLTDANGKVHRLSDYRGKTVVLEWINPNCPFSRRQAVEKVMTTLAAKHADTAWLAINSTRKGHADYLEPAQHLDWNREHGILYPVLYDASGVTGQTYGARTTPHMFVVNAEGKVVYAGAIDDDPSGRQAATARTNYVDAALAALGTGKAVETASTKPYGCSVKY